MIEWWCTGSIGSGCSVLSANRCANPVRSLACLGHSHPAKRVEPETTSPKRQTGTVSSQGRRDSTTTTSDSLKNHAMVAVGITSKPGKISSTKASPTVTVGMGRGHGAGSTHARDPVRRHAPGYSHRYAERNRHWLVPPPANVRRSLPQTSVQNTHLRECCSRTSRRSARMRWAPTLSLWPERVT